MLPVIDSFLNPVKRLGVFVSGVIFTAAAAAELRPALFQLEPDLQGHRDRADELVPGLPLAAGTCRGTSLWVAIFLSALGIAAERITRRYDGR